MKRKKLKKRLGEIEWAIERLTRKVHEVGRYAVRVDEDVEELAVHVKKLRFPNDETLKDVDPGAGRLQKQLEEIRRSTRMRVTGEGHDVS